MFPTLESCNAAAHAAPASFNFSAAMSSEPVELTTCITVSSSDANTSFSKSLKVGFDPSHGELLELGKWPSTRSFTMRFKSSAVDVAESNLAAAPNKTWFWDHVIFAFSWVGMAGHEAFTESRRGLKSSIEYSFGVSVSLCKFVQIRNLLWRISNSAQSWPWRTSSFSAMPRASVAGCWQLWEGNDQQVTSHIYVQINHWHCHCLP